MTFYDSKKKKDLVNANSLNGVDFINVDLTDYLMIGLFLSHVEIINEELYYLSLLLLNKSISCNINKLRMITLSFLELSVQMIISSLALDTKNSTKLNDKIDKNNYPKVLVIGKYLDKLVFTISQKTLNAFFLLNIDIRQRTSVKKRQIIKNFNQLQNHQLYDCILVLLQPYFIQSKDCFELLKSCYNLLQPEGKVLFEVCIDCKGELKKDIVPMVLQIGFHNIQIIDLQREECIEWFQNNCIQVPTSSNFNFQGGIRFLCFKSLNYFLNQPQKSSVLRLINGNGSYLRASSVCLKRNSDNNNSMWDFLLVKRINHFSVSSECSWSLPGGGIEENESLQNAVLREAFEEAGIEGSIMSYLGEFSSFSKKKNKFTISYAFSILVNNEVSQGRWIESLLRERKWFNLSDENIAKLIKKEQDKNILQASVKFLSNH